MSDTPFYRQPAPAVGIAIAAGLAAHAANMNAAKALDESTAFVAIAITLLVMAIIYIATH